MLGLPNPFLYIGLGLVVACGVFFGLWRWDAHELTLANGKLDIAQQDAARWHKASDERDKVIETFKTAWENSNAKVEAARIDNAKLNTINARFAEALRAEREPIETKIQETQHDARQHPEQVHHLGPVACALYRRLYGDAAACTDTQSANAN